MAEGMPVFLYGVECSGPDKELSDCMNTANTISECSSAGVTCEKSSSEAIFITVLYHNVGRRYIGMARMPASRNTFSKPPNSQTKGFLYS